MSGARLTQKLLGTTDDSQVFKKTWEDNGFAKINRNGVKITSPWRKRLFKQLKEKNDGFVKDNKGLVKKALHTWSKHGVTKERLQKRVQDLSEAERKGVMDADRVEDHVPLVFDPEILAILKNTAPISTDVIAEEGQEGFKAVANRIDDRDDPVGHVSESGSLNLYDQEKGVDFEKIEEDMTIYVDVVSISEFSQAASEHYMDVRETTVGQRVAAFGQDKEAKVLYADPDQEAKDEEGDDTGGIGSENVYKGLAKWFSDADAEYDEDHEIDKSSVSEDFLQDIKAEIYDLLQSDLAVTADDLVVAVSYTMHDILENEIDSPHARHPTNADYLNWGGQELAVGGVPIVPTHMIREHVDGSDSESGSEYTVGDEGDVFIINTRAARFRVLTPFSTVPLGMRGLADEAAMFEFGALIDRADGRFGKWLKAYDI